MLLIVHMIGQVVRVIWQVCEGLHLSERSCVVVVQAQQLHTTFLVVYSVTLACILKTKIHCK